MADHEAGKRKSDVELLQEFLETLPASDYQIDTRQYMVLNDLLLHLFARGIQIDARLKTFIAPVVCSTPEEQNDFYERFDQWHRTWIPASVEAGVVRPALTTSEPIRPPEPAPSLLPAFFTILGIASTILTIVWLASTTLSVTVPRIDISNPVLVILGIGGFISFSGWRFWRLYNDNQFIARALSDQEPIHQKVPMRQYAKETVPAMQFKTVVKALRKRVQVPSTEVDIDETIENALRNNQWLEFIYRTRQVMPEYVVLIDRKSHQDQQARFVQELLQRLSKSSVWIHQYEFSGDPRLCFPPGRRDTPLQLTDLQTRYQDARLLIFSGTSELINPNTGSLREWADQLSFWKDRAILTPDPIWKSLRDALRAYGITILPLSLESFPFLTTIFEGQTYVPAHKAQPPLPEALLERPERWLGRVSPPEEEIDALLSDLKSRYLRANGLYWLGALAVYPELRWEMTMHLGNQLRDERGKPLYHPDLIMRLTRLPWLRHGYMPDWIRIKLIDSLDAQQNKSTRKVLAEAFNPDSKPGVSDVQIAKTVPPLSTARLKKLIRARFRRAQVGSPERDYVFVKFMTGSENQKLGVSLPQHLRRIFVPIVDFVSGIRAAWRSFLRWIGGDFFYRMDRTEQAESEGAFTTTARHMRDSSQSRQADTNTGAASETKASRRFSTIETSRLIDGLFPEFDWLELTNDVYEQVVQRFSKDADLEAEVVKYIKRNRVRIGFHRQYTSGGGWTFRGNITLTPGDDPLSPYVLSQIAHETFHLNQSIWMRLSMQGELRAWQYQRQAYHKLTGREIGDLGEAYAGTKQYWDQLAQLSPDSYADLLKAETLMKQIAPSYRSDVLPLYPLPSELGFFLRKGKVATALSAIRNLFTGRTARRDAEEDLAIDSNARPSSLRGRGLGKIFIGYSRKDMDFTRKLAGDLERAGYDVWWDLANLRGGDDWLRAIPEAIASSQYFIVILTPNSVQSDWVQKEYTQALSMSKKIIPIMLQRTSVPFALNTLNYIDFANGKYSDNFNNLLLPLGYTTEQVKTEEKPKDTIRKYFDRQLIPQVARDSYSDGMAWLLAGMSQLSYDPFEESEPARALFLSKLDNGGFRLIATFGSDVTDTHAFLASNGIYNILAFRGTEAGGATNLRTNANAALISTLEGKIHKGFLEAYNSIAANIEKELRQRDPLPLYITGHGLGAALAIVATQKLERELRQGPTACYTFGSPRVGSLTFDPTPRTPIYRVVNASDIVTVIPLLALGYNHVGDVHFLGRRDGQIGRGIPIFQRLFLFVAASFRLFSPWITDHNIREYRRKLEIIARDRDQNAQRESVS